MLQDSRLVLMDDQAISGAATTLTPGENEFAIDGSQKIFSSASTGNSILLNAAINDLGKAGKMALVVEVGSTGGGLIGTGGTANMQVKLYEHTAADVESGTAVMWVHIPGIVVTTPAAHVVSGKRLFKLIVPPDVWGDTTNKYIGIAVLNSTQTITGSLNAWLEEV